MQSMPFSEEVKNISTSDIKIILEDQLDLYSKDEISILRKELESRPSDSIEMDEAKKLDMFELEDEQYIKELESEERDNINAFNGLIMTNGYNFEGFNIIKYHKVISAETVLIRKLFDEFEQLIEETRDSSMDKLIEKAIKLNANAIIGVNFDYEVFNDYEIGVIINGTAVSIEKSK